MPDKVSKEKQDALVALGAEIVVCPTAASPSSEDHYVCTARRLKSEITGVFMLNQYDNPLDSEAHFLTTGPEIWAALGDRITAFVAAGSAGGTISGVSCYLRTKNLILEPYS